AYCKNFEQTLRSVWVLTDAVISNTEKGASPAEPTRPARPAGAPVPPPAPSPPAERQPAQDGTARSGAESVRGRIVNVVKEPGQPDVGVLNLGGRHGLAKGDAVAVYRNGVPVANLTVGHLSDDYASVLYYGGRLDKGDSVVVSVNSRRGAAPVALARNP